MKQIMKTLALVLATVAVSSFASAQLQSGNVRPKGPLTPIDFNAPTSLSVLNHSSSWIDLTASDVDEYWIYDINKWKPIPGNNTSGTVTLSGTSYGGTGVLVQYLSTTGTISQKTYRFGVTADISGLSTSVSFILTFTYDDGDPESLLYDSPVSKSTTVTVTPNGN